MCKSVGGGSGKCNTEDPQWSVGRLQRRGRVAKTLELGASSITGEVK